jgi:hypothetical protein
MRPPNRPHPRRPLRTPRDPRQRRRWSSSDMAGPLASAGAPSGSTAGRGGSTAGVTSSCARAAPHMKPSMARARLRLTMGFMWSFMFSPTSFAVPGLGGAGMVSGQSIDRARGPVRCRVRLAGGRGSKKRFPRTGESRRSRSCPLSGELTFSTPPLVIGYGGNADLVHAGEDALATGNRRNAFPERK